MPEAPWIRREGANGALKFTDDMLADEEGEDDNDNYEDGQSHQ